MNGGAQDPGVEGEILRLHDALGISYGDVADFVVAGGKSSAILTIAGELSEAGRTVLTVSTTNLFVREAEKIGPLVIAAESGELLAKVEEAFSGGVSAVVIGSGLLSKNHLGGVEPGEVSSLA